MTKSIMYRHAAQQAIPFGSCLLSDIGYMSRTFCCAHSLAYWPIRAYSKAKQVRRALTFDKVSSHYQIIDYLLLDLLKVLTPKEICPVLGSFRPTSAKAVRNPDRKPINTSGSNVPCLR